MSIAEYDPKNRCDKIKSTGQLCIGKRSGNGWIYYDRKTGKAIAHEGDIVEKDLNNWMGLYNGQPMSKIDRIGNGSYVKPIVTDENGNDIVYDARKQAGNGWIYYYEGEEVYRDANAVVKESKNKKEIPKTEQWYRDEQRKAWEKTKSKEWWNGREFWNKEQYIY